MAKSVILILDAQNAFCSPQGSLWRKGYTIFNLSLVISAIEQLLSYAHTNEIPVILTKMQSQGDYLQSNLHLTQLTPETAQIGAFLKDPWDSSIFDFRNRSEKDLTLTKKRFDPFLGTDLEAILRNSEVDHLIVAGFLTNICVESCVRSAFDRDFKVTVIEDATSTYSQPLRDASIETMRRHFAKVLPVKSLLDSVQRE